MFRKINALNHLNFIAQLWFGGIQLRQARWNLHPGWGCIWEVEQNEKQNSMSQIIVVEKVFVQGNTSRQILIFKILSLFLYWLLAVIQMLIKVLLLTIILKKTEIPI